MIHIVNYGLGNLGSIKNMLSRLGYNSVITSDPQDILDAEKIILPGVGAFDTGMEHLNTHNWIGNLEQKALVEKIPVLGICLGMQLMTRKSEEGVLPGLGWVNGEVVRFADASLKVPHMGWNVVKSLRGDSILGDTEEKEIRFYFVHSYYVKLENPVDELGIAHYGRNFVAAFQKDNIIGVQFHPEKSHKFGMNLLKKFAAL